MHVADLLQFIKEIIITVLARICIYKICHQTQLEKHFHKPIKLAVMQNKFSLVDLFLILILCHFVIHDFPTGNLQMHTQNKR